MSRIWRAFVVGIVVLVLVSCASPSTRQINWRHIIPDGYHGFLVIRYDCPNGHPLDIRAHEIVVAYDPGGVFCTSDSFFPTRGQESAQSTSGRPIPVVAAPREATGYGFFGIGTQGIGSETVANPGPNDIILGIGWVGTMEASPPAPGAPDLDDFLEDRLGIPQYRE